MSRSTIGGGWGCNKIVPVLGEDGTKLAPLGDLFDQPPDEMNTIRGKLADHAGDHVVLSPEGVVLVPSPGTKSSYPRPPPIVGTLNTVLSLSLSLSLSLRVLRLPYQPSHCRFGIPSVGPTNTAAKRLNKLPTVTPGATSILSIYSAPLFHCRYSGPFSSPLSHETINLQPPSTSVMCRALVHIIKYKGSSVMYIASMSGKTMR